MPKGVEVPVNQESALEALLTLPPTATLAETMTAYYRLERQAREFFAGNERTRLDVLRVLAEERGETIRARVAINKSADEPLLRTLAEDPDPEVRRVVAHNFKCPPDVLDALSRDAVREVRKSVGMCHRTPLPALERLVRDPVRFVRGAAMTNPVWPREDLERLGAEFRETTEEEGLAANVNLPPEMLREIALRAPRTPGKKESRKFRAAANPSTPEDALLVLADTGDYNSGLLRNPKVPSIAVQRIAEGGDDPHVRKRALEVRAARIFEATGVQPDNVGAQDYLVDTEWWTLTPDSPEVTLALALSPDL